MTCPECGSGVIGCLNALCLVGMVSVI